MNRNAAQLRTDAEQIWRAGVAAVAPARLIESHIHLDGHTLVIDEEVIDLAAVARIAIVGGGKAAGALAIALADTLGETLLHAKQAIGWVNVPADCVTSARSVHLHAGRPAGVNEPRAEGVEGTRQILKIVTSLGPHDLCFCLLTGGGSALLPAPVPEITFDDKLRVTQLLSAAGANIEQLNTVRRQLSLVKGGGLARACGAGRLVTLIISDVLGDSLEIIASGPTVPGATTASDAVAVLDTLSLSAEPAVARIVHFLRGQESPPLPLGAGRGEGLWPASRGSSLGERPIAHVSHHILGNNATAVDAAGIEAERLGYSHAMISASRSEGAAEDVGRHLAEMALRMRNEGGPDCLISGGEPTVTLVDESRRGQGGRNQQLALAALAELDNCDGIALLAGGTDGEDGPTDAAGAIVAPDVVRAAKERGLDPHDYLSRNDAYNFFRQTGGLFITGPTQTNVCDLRVVTVNQSHHH